MRHTYKPLAQQYPLATAEAAKRQRKNPAADDDVPGGRPKPSKRGGRDLPNERDAADDDEDDEEDEDAAARLFAGKVQAEMGRNGGSRMAAVQAVGRRYPELHRAYLMAGNRTAAARRQIRDRFAG